MAFALAAPFSGQGVVAVFHRKFAIEDEGVQCVDKQIVGVFRVTWRRRKPLIVPLESRGPYDLTL